MSPKPTDIVPIKLRMREGLRRKLERAAEKAAHSTNIEAVKRIEYTFAEEEEHEAQWKWMEERKDELDEEQRRWHEEQAREKAEHEAALRDSKLLNRLIGNNYESALLLHFIMEVFPQEPDWFANPESRKAFADRVHEFITNSEYTGGSK